MIDAYKIGVRIGVTDGTRGNVLKIAAQFAKAQAEASGFLKTLRAVNDELSRKTSWASSAAQDFRNARREAEGYARAAQSARSATGGSGTATSGASAAANMAVAASINRMQQQDRLFFRGYPNAALSFDSARRLGSPAVRLLGSSSGSGSLVALAGGGGSMTALGGAGGGSMIPPGSGGGAGLPAGGSGGLAAAGWPFGFGGGRGSGGAGGGNNGFNYGAFGRMMGGAMLARGGEVELGMLKGPVEAAARFQSAVARFQLFGLGDQLNADAVKFARGMNIVGTSMTDAVNFMTEAQGVFRESGLQGAEALRGAKLAAPMLAKIAFATSGLDEDSQAKMHTQSLAMLRFIEMRGGLKDAKTFNSIADAGWKAIRSSGGNVNWEQLRQFMSTGGVSVQGLSDTALFGELEPIIGELKGMKAGMSLRTAYNRVHGIVRLPNQVAHQLVDSGIWDAKAIEWNSNGGIKAFKKDPLKNAELFDKDAPQFYAQMIKPMYERMGIKTPTQINRENAMIFGSTGGALFSLIDKQWANIQRSVDAQKKTLGIDQSVGVARNTFQGQMKDYRAKMEDLQMILGTTILPMLVRGLLWLNPKLREAAAWIGQHSTLTKGLLLVFAGFGVLATVSGAIVSIGGAFTLISGAVAAGGGLAVGLSTVGSLLTGFVAPLALVGIFAYKLGQGLDSLIEKFPRVDNAIGNVAAHIAASFGSQNAADAIAYSDGRTPEAERTLQAMARKHAEWKAHLASNYGSGGNGTIQVNSTLNMDGRKVAQGVTQHQTREANRPQTGMSSFDSSMAPGPIGYVGM